MPLKPKQKTYLKKLAHQLKPVVLIGGNGLTDGVLEEARLSLEHHELIKIRIGVGDRIERQTIIDQIAEQLKCEVVQIIGRMVIIYKVSPKMKIEFPKQ